MRVFYPNIRYGWRMLLESLADVGPQLPEGLDGQRRACSLESRSHVNGLSEYVVPLIRRDTKMTRDDRPEARFDSEPAFPAAVRHELVGGILESEQRQETTIDGLGRKHAESRAPDALPERATGRGTRPTTQ